MNVALRRALTVPEYLAWGETRSERQRTELINGQIVAMSPERADHNRTKARVYLALDAAVRSAGLACEVFTDGMTVSIDAHTAYEPDAVVHCGTPIAPEQMTIPAPIIIVEVLSPSAAHTDTSAKLIGYFKLASVCHYLVIDPQARSVTHHARAFDGTLEAMVVTSGTITLDPPNLQFPIASLFAA
jgi:Uma2 family endonuclease